jgi:NTP pyrophosphatase (non-canonical NTP hydrolase)
MMNFLSQPATPEEAASVAEFIVAFNGSLDPRLYVQLSIEECGEAIQAFESEGQDQQLKELADLRYVLIGLALTMSPTYAALQSTTDAAINETANDLYNKLIDTLSIVKEPFTEYQLSEAFRRVHNSNMSKLDEDGKPIFREDGKVMKGPGYKAPDLIDLIVGEAA